MERMRARFGALSTGAKALIVAVALVLFAVLSPLMVILATLFLVVCVPVVAYRMLTRRPFRRPALVLLGSLVVLLLASGASTALYGTSGEQTGSPSDTQTAPREERPRKEPKRVEAAAAPTENSEEDKDPQPEKDAAEPEPGPKPKPEPDPEPEPKPKPDPKPRPDRSPYDATVTVSRVVDGDTIEVSPGIDGVQDVRLIGIDTPETVDPGEEVEPYGPEASSFATAELAGRRVGLEFDVERIDQYDRLLAYVYLGGEMFNEDLLEEGYAQAYPYPPNTAHELRFERAQRKARADDLGIWGLPLERQCLLADRGNGIGEGSIKCDLLAEESASPSASAGSAGPSGGGAVAPASEDDCPASAPIKGNQSGLYHVPEGAYYEVTNPEECFTTAEDAEAAGYEASSR